MPVQRSLAFEPSTPPGGTHREAADSPLSRKENASQLVRLSLGYVASAIVGSVLLAIHAWQPLPGGQAPLYNAGAVAISQLLSVGRLPPPAPLQPLLNGTYELLKVGESDSVELVYQAPDNATAVLLLAHGCSHSATDWWPRGAHCNVCVGLPEEVAVVTSALSEDYLVVAFSSANRASRCWSPGVDGPRVLAALEALLGRLGAAHLPRLALGGSSGGAFVALLPSYAEKPFAALCIQIMAVAPQELEAVARASHGYPPSLWVHMVRDKRMADGVAASLSALQLGGWKTAEVRIEQQPLLPGTLQERMGVDGETSVRVHAALVSAGLLDEAGMQKDDPRRSGWREAVAQAGGVEGDSLEPDASPLAEELNVLWAQHELTRDAMGQTLAFFREALEAASAHPALYERGVGVNFTAAV